MAQGSRLMVLVDTTVWIDFFAGRAEPHVLALEEMIAGNENISTCGVILTEVLQGIRSDADYAETKEYFEALVVLSMDHVVFVRAAEIYRSLRKRGITIRKSVDCMIASVAIEHGVQLLHNDRDFDPIARHTDLKTIRFRKPAR